ncbi:hypothetical protein B0T11DRAFT_127782 [Plectosphaerella cucumerina]|uniref:Uncharacterized protein n=1 Tax=Plectosphaerella cucumerina TaxID=40658 RepID=A0A8K0X0E5_9PEZI|nr:hypothetical protein B0T11DRAFT_127782 [Plectosphaerella cucumerina]
MSLLLSVPRRSARERQGVFEVILDISTIRPEDSRAAWRQQAGYLNDGCARLYEIRRNPSNPASAFCPTLALQLLNSRPFYLRSASHKLSRWSCAAWLSIISPRDRGSTGRCGCGALERSTHLVGSGHFSNRFASPRLGGHAGRCEREHHRQSPRARGKFAAPPTGTGTRKRQRVSLGWSNCQCRHQAPPLLLQGTTIANSTAPGPKLPRTTISHVPL